MRVQLMRLFAFVLLALPFFAEPAHAQFRVCNKTPAPISVALAFETTQDVVSQGWWTVDPDNCTVLINTPLDKRYYYHYVLSNALKVEWRGTYEFCTSGDPQFRITGSQNCESRSYTTTGFRQTDIGTSNEYTLNVRTGPAPASENVVTPAPATPPAVTPETPAVTGAVTPETTPPVAAPVVEAPVTTTGTPPETVPVVTPPAAATSPTPAPTAPAAAQ